MARKPKTTESAGPGEPRYIELVNWRAAQPNLPDRDAPWIKLYTSLLDNDAFQGLDDTARMLIIALWLYAGHSGRHIFPADPRWLRRKIPLLNSDPDLRPLLEAQNAYGEPKPFVRIVDKTGIYNVRNSQRREEREKETKTKTKPLRASEKKKKEKERVSGARPQKREQTPEQSPEHIQPQTADQTRAKPVNPPNPKESEDGGAACAVAPKAPPLAMRAGPCRLGKVPIWWADPACTAFSYAVFDALGLRMDPESRSGKAERGTFAAWLFETRAATPVAGWAEVEAHALAKAREIARYGKSARSRGAVWLSIVRKIAPARAGPKAAAL